MGSGRQSNGFLLTPLREVETEIKKGDKMNNKIIGMLTMFTVASVLLGSVAFAVPPVATTFDTAWNGAGNFEAHFVSGDDAHANFWTGGTFISGEFHGTDSNDNPYNYNVDTTEAKVKSHVENGFIEYSFVKDSNYAPMYGPAGQESYTFIGTDGTGDFAWRSTGNYAALTNSNYGWQNNNQMQAMGDHYIYHSLALNPTNGASITVDANGSTQISEMCDSTWVGSYNFGKGCGCYTNANVNTVGSGIFDLTAVSGNHVTTDSGITVDGGTLNIHSIFSNGFHFSNFALTGN